MQCCYAECHYAEFCSTDAECRYAECYYGECCGAIEKGIET